MRVGGEDVLAVVHRRGLLDDPALVGRARDHRKPGAQHERLHAAPCPSRGAARVAARIVAEADTERRALERDLHDGAQQRLVSVALSIRLARRTIAPDDPALDAAWRAEDGVRAAVVALREVAHGLFPAVLAEEGLAAALEELSEHAPRLVPRALRPAAFPAKSSRRRTSPRSSRCGWRSAR